MKLSKLAERMANDLCIFKGGLSIQDFTYALEDKEQISKLLEKEYALEEIKQVYDELIYVRLLIFDLINLMKENNLNEASELLIQTIKENRFNKNE